MKYHVIAQLEADSLEEAWANIQHLPLALTPDELENAVSNGVTGVALFQVEGHGRVEWRAE